MKKIRIVLGSNDGESIFPSHMGMAKYFYVKVMLWQKGIGRKQQAPISHCHYHIWYK